MKRRIATIHIIGLLVITLVVIGVSYFVFFISPSQTDTSQSGMEPSPVVFSDVSSWKQYKNNELGLSFAYPNEWPSLQVTKKEEKGGAVFSDEAAGWVNGVPAVSVSSPGVDFQIVSKGYNQGSDSFLSCFEFNKQPINLKWSQKEFEEQMDTCWDILYYSVNDNYLTVGVYTSYECSTTFKLVFLKPFKQEYPNLEWSIYPVLESSPTASVSDDPCDSRSDYEVFLQKLDTQPQMQRLIKTVETILDTVVVD